MKTAVQTASEAIYQAQYDDKTRVLVITFQYGPPKNYDGTYKYVDVPPEVFQGFLNAESKGKYFNENIRNNFDVIK